METEIIGTYWEFEYDTEPLSLGEWIGYPSTQWWVFYNDVPVMLRLEDDGIFYEVVRAKR